MISHKHKAIFVHVPKAAGQSVENFFLASLGFDWESRAPLLLRPKTSLDPEEAPFRLAHLSAEEYVRFHYLSDELFSCYFSFSFVRNPFSRAVSMYRYMGYDKLCSFSKFISYYLSQKLWSGKQYYFLRPQSEFTHDVNGSQLIDFVGKFESLETDFKIVADRLGFERHTLPHVNSSGDRGRKRFAVLRRLLVEKRLHRPPKYSRWQDYYDRESIKTVLSLYQRDFKIYGYDDFPLNSSHDG